MNGSAARDDLATCRRLLREGSMSFSAASLLLPKRVRDDAAAVYAWCRVADHAVDRSTDPQGSLERVRASLERVYSVAPDGPVERAFADAVIRNRIPAEVPLAMLRGFEWDATGRAYETLDQTIDYCVRVGSTVGVMMSLVMGRRDPLTLQSAARLGAAMQLTNIARDVGDDAAASRVYLPLSWLRDGGTEPETWLRDPSPTPGLRASAWEGIDDLPSRCRPAIRAAALIYAEIGREIRRSGCDTVSRRAWTGRGTKLRLLLQAGVGLPGAWVRTGPSVGPAAASVEISDQRAAFLVAAVAGMNHR